MGKYIKRFRNHAEYEAYTASTEFVKPNVSSCINGADVHYTSKPHDYSKDYLTFEALENGTFQFTNDISYSLDNGNTWTELSANTDSPIVTANKKIRWKGELIPIVHEDKTQVGGIGVFSSTSRFNVEGNPMSLLYGDNFKGQTDLTGKHSAFYRLFYSCSNLINAEHLSLPATILAEQCYSSMFNSCTNLVTAPQLPATTLANYCYGWMFENCTSLATAPQLSATTLANYCYAGMFNGCTSLTTAPQLSATTLANGCYNYMFNGCTHLTSITCLATDISATSCTTKWLSGVAASGTFTKAASMESWTTGGSGIPSNWTVVDAQ